MPANIREIKGRIKAVKNIQRITKTMQMIATARFQAMQRRATQAHAYADHIGEMVGEVTASVGEDEISHPLLRKPTGEGKTLLLAISSDRGLCGSYNTNVLRMVDHHLRDALPPERRRFEVVGKKGVGYAKFNRIPVDEAHLDFGDSPSYEDIAALADRYIADFVDGTYDAVKVAYTKFVTMGQQVPEIVQLLPLDREAVAGEEGEAAGPSTQANYEFSPDAATLLAELLPVTVKVTLQRCFNDALVSEQLARMVAMKAATDAAGKQGKSLKRQFNRARQTAITTELSEIIAGAAALE